MTTLIKKICLRMGIVILIALAILLTPNLPLFDETLSPEITERLKQSLDPEIDGNGIYQLQGLQAESGKDPQTVGLAVIKTLQSKHAKGDEAKLTEQETRELYGDKDNGDKEWESIYSATNCKPRENVNCFAELLKQLKENPVTNERLKVQQERFERLIQQPHLIEITRTMDLSSPIPPYDLAIRLSQLQQTLAYQQEGLNGLILQSQKDMVFWRNALKENQTLIGRMVTLKALHANLLSLSYAISNTPELSAEQTQQLQQLLKPLTPTEITFDNPLIGELRFVAENQSIILKENPWYIRHMMQPTATANRYYRDTLLPGFRFGQLSPKDFYGRAQTPIKPSEFSWLNPYNLGGKVSLSNTGLYADYIGRNHDLAGIYSLVALQLSLKNTAQDQWLDAIKTSPFQNHYTLKPFDVDTSKHSLSFTCFNPRDSCKIQWKYE